MPRLLVGTWSRHGASRAEGVKLRERPHRGSKWVEHKLHFQTAARPSRSIRWRSEDSSRAQPSTAVGQIHLRTPQSWSPSGDLNDRSWLTRMLHDMKRSGRAACSGLARSRGSVEPAWFVN